MNSYSHHDNNIVYILENILGPPEETNEYKSLHEQYNSQISSYCECEEFCHTNCACITLSGMTNYEALQGNTGFQINSKKMDTKFLHPVFECNSLCKCSRHCGNRIVQHGPIDGLVIKNCQKGKGLFSANLISTGTFLCEYAGEIITKTQAVNRLKMNLQRGNMNYIFCLNEYCNENVNQTIVDPSQFGNIGRYINHSCEPNAQIIPVRVDSPTPKLAIFACKDIMAGTEITFDYGPQSSIRVSANDCEKKKCLCGSQLCRTWMPFDRI